MRNLPKRKMFPANVESVVESFVKLHASRTFQCNNERVAHIAQYNELGMPLDIGLQAFGVEQIVREFDTASKPVQWLLHQLTTFDAHNERIVGLSFDSAHVLAHVVSLHHR